MGAVLILAVLIIKINRVEDSFPTSSGVSSKPADGNIGGMEKFSSEQDFKNYLEESSKLVEGYSGGFGIQRMNQLGIPSVMLEKSAGVLDETAGSAALSRISETNVQVAGIDEPDIIKTDGKEIYFSSQQKFYSSGISLPERRQMMPSGEMMPPRYQSQEKTNIISAFPPADLKIEGEIDKQGELLLDKNNLIIFSGQEIIGYDVSSPKTPEKKWTVKLNKNTSTVASRLRDGKIYLIAKNVINQSRPCPFEPLLSENGAGLNIRCADIYHPIAPTPIDSTFTAMILNPNTGKIENSVSFTGSSGSSIIYMSENAIYASHTFSESIAKFFSGFVKENGDIFSAEIIEKIKKLEGYDISENSKLQEITILIEKYNNSFGDDERLKKENETANRMSAYYKKHNRELEKTGIVKIALDNFQVAANGAVPGNLLNNFAMDEYQGNLRVATTVGSRWGIFNGIGSGESVSDVYVLDKNLQAIGQVLDLGKTERIYSARFIEDKGYIVTFRQTDPFYVIDLKNPTSPALAGELKIPGYSSYLHPLDATHILGVGMEGSQVKISLFDVSDKNNPTELDKYLLDEHWSEVSNNYHAFLLDKKHGIFFLPGSKGGYVFSYDAYKLQIKKAVEQNLVKRAIYINDYLYIIGEDKITVLNELDWEKINEMEL